MRLLMTTYSCAFADIISGLSVYRRGRSNLSGYHCRETDPEYFPRLGGHGSTLQRCKSAGVGSIYLRFKVTNK